MFRRVSVFGNLESEVSQLLLSLLPVLLSVSYDTVTELVKGSLEGLGRHDCGCLLDKHSESIERVSDRTLLRFSFHSEPSSLYDDCLGAALCGDFLEGDELTIGKLFPGVLDLGEHLDD